MRRSKNKHFVHLIWDTKHREPSITSDIERTLYRSISGIAMKMGCIVRAVGGMPDHVHLLLWIPNTLSVMDVMKRIKGGSSSYINTQRNREPYFDWQEGYAVFGVAPEGVAPVTAYILNQKQHHAAQTLNTDWEEIQEDVNASGEP